MRWIKKTCTDEILLETIINGSFMVILKNIANYIFLTVYECNASLKTLSWV